MKNIYKIMAEADRKPFSDRLLFGSALKPDPTSLNWVGGAYVIADNPVEAERKFEAFFREHATAWSFDTKPQAVRSLKGWVLDFEAAVRRDHLWRFEQGEVITGWGM